jgi:hypothetical protein
LTFRQHNPRMKRRIAIFGVAGLLALNAVLLLIEPGLALPPALGNYFFGNRLVRADVVVNQNGIHQYRLDQGRILRTQGSSLLLREEDGTVVTVPVAPDADVLLPSGRHATVARLRKNQLVTTIREGAAAASEVRVRRPG